MRSNKKTLFIVIGIITIFIFTSIIINNIFLKQENKIKIKIQNNTIGIIVEGQEQDSFPSKQDYEFEKAVCNGVEVTASDTGTTTFNINISGISATSNCTFYFIHQQFEQLVNYTMLYDEGNECEEISGGWGIEGYSFYYNHVSRYATLYDGDKNSDHIYLLGHDNSGGYNIEVAGNLKALPGGYPKIGFVAEWTNYPYWHSHSSKEMDIYVTSEQFSQSSPKAMHVRELPADNKYILFDSNLSNRPMKIYDVILLKSDNWQELCTKVGITAPATLEELVIDATKLNAILSNQDAVNFMIKQCTGDFMASAVSSSIFKTALNSSTYKSLIESNEHWNKFLNMID